MADGKTVKSLEIKTEHAHVFILRRKKGWRLEVEDAFFNTGSAVLLPTIPLSGSDEPGQSLDFSNEELWQQLEASHKGFTEHVRAEPFEPHANGGGDQEREPGLHVIIAALRFLEQNPLHKLFITGHADRAGSESYNLHLSDARARSTLALLEADRDGFVKACSEFNTPEDDPIILECAARDYAWPCDTVDLKRARHEEIRAFQKAYNGEFNGSLMVDGVVGDNTRGAYYDVYQDIMARSVGGAEVLQSLRGRLRFVDAGRKFLACGERFPIENPEQDGYRSQRNRRVELLFFSPPDVPDLSDSTAVDRIYQKRLYGFTKLDREELATSNQASANESSSPLPMQLVDADAVETGTGEQEEELTTTMLVLGEENTGDLWAFLDPFDSAHPDVGHQAIRDTDTVIV